MFSQSAEYVIYINKERVLLIVMLAPTAGIVEFKSMPVVCLCSSRAGVQELVDESKRLSKGTDVVLVLGYSDRAVSRILPAYVNATIRTREGTARSRSMQVEMLMLVCGTMNIGKALKSSGAKDSRKFLAFASSAALFSRFAKRCAISRIRSIRPGLVSEEAGDVAITELLND